MRSSRDRMTIVQAKLALEIGTAKDQNGKPAYSNEQLRSAALTLALEAHDDYRQLREKSRAVNNRAISELLIDHNILVDQKCLLMVELGIPLETEGQKYPH